MECYSNLEIWLLFYQYSFYFSFNIYYLIDIDVDSCAICRSGIMDACMSFLYFVLIPLDIFFTLLGIECSIDSTLNSNEGL